MKKLIFTLLLVIMIFVCQSQTPIENKQSEYLSIKEDGFSFSVKQEADSLFVYTSTFGYEKANQKENYFTISHQQDSLDYSYFTYSIYKFKNGIQQIIGNGIHRGRFFPEMPKNVKELKGDISAIPISSIYLNEKRSIYVYKPSNYDNLKSYGLLVILDANEGALRYHCSMIENLIDENKIEELIVVGVPNKEQVDKYNNEIDFRALEFLENYSTSNHSSHHGHTDIPKELKNRHAYFINFIENEVYSYIVNEYHITDDFYKKGIYGTSNGGAFVVSLSRKKPHLFGSNIAFSFGWDDNVKTPDWTLSKFPKFYLAVGKYEKDFNEVVRKWKAILDEKGSSYHYSEPLSGHDNAMWAIVFEKYLKEIYRK